MSNRVFAATRGNEIPSVSNGHLRLPPQTISALSADSPRRLALRNQQLRRASLSNLNDSRRARSHSDRTDSGAISSMINGRLGFKRRMRNRLMQKNGTCNIQLANVPKQSSKYFSDIFTTIIEIKWRWCLFMFAASYIISWTFFTTLFYIIAVAHGDMEVDHLDESVWTPCVTNGHSFLAMLMFSIESQSTIGYGSRYPTEECGSLVAIVGLQNLMGILIQSLMAGLVFAKLARPKKRAQTILFSKHAVICKQDGKLCLLIRLGDMRQSVLAEAHVRLQMVKKYVTEEGELQPFHQFDMSVGYDSGNDRVFIIWPITICHVIDKESPFYDLSRQSLQSGDARFELIAILEGVVESTGSTTQARTSFLPQEIIWGHRFEKLVTYQRDNGDYRIDFGLFHNTYPCECPDMSAKQLDQLEEENSNSSGSNHDEADDVAVQKSYYTVPSNLNSYSKRPSVKQLLEPLHESYRIVSPDRSTNSTGSTTLEEDSLTQAVPVDMNNERVRKQLRFRDMRRASQDPVMERDGESPTSHANRKSQQPQRRSWDVESQAHQYVSPRRDQPSPNYVVTSSTSLERLNQQPANAAAKQPTPKKSSPNRKHSQSEDDKRTPTNKTPSDDDSD